jgi:predicted dehydrogenase
LTDRPLGFGVVGAGTIGAQHAAALRGVGGATLVAVCEPRVETGQRLAAEYGVEWCPDLAALLARSDVQVVVLATPSGLHARQCLEAAEAGKHVVAEKPVATTLADTDRMREACRRAGVRLAVVFQNRFQRPALRLKRAVEAGLFGRIVLAGAYVHWSRSREYFAASGGWRGTWVMDGGGALINQSIHYLDLLLWILGPIARVTGFTATLAHPIQTEDTVSAALVFQSGALATVQGSTALHRDRPARIEVHGQEGSAVLEGRRLAIWEPGRAEAPLSAADLESTCEPGDEDAFWLGHQAQFRAIVQALRRGEQPPVDPLEARHALEAVLAIYEAARNGRQVTLPLASATA